MKKFNILMLAFMLTSSILLSQTKFVCIGNSITHGKYTRGHQTGTTIGDSLFEMSYRFWFWEKIDSAGINATMVGYHTKYFDQWANVSVQTSRYTGHTFVNNHEAYYGIKSDAFVNGGWDKDGLNCPNFDTRLSGYMPDVALIHIGTNDVEATAADVLASENNIKSIITKLRAKNPNVTILLARLISDWIKISKEMPRIANETTTSTSIVYCVDMATGFIANKDNPETMTLDGLHPNAKGQKFMAQRWYDAYMKVTKTDAAAPSAPSNVFAASVTATSANVSWTGSTDNTGVNVYRVYVNDVLVGETGKTSLALTGQNFSIASVIKITAVDYKKNESAKSTGYNATPSTVTFIVKDTDNTLLQGAKTTFNLVTKTSDASGKTVYSSINANTYSYTVTNSGFTNVSGSAVISKDTTINIIMEETPQIISMQEINSLIKIYPQPATGYVTIEGANGAFIEILDLLGKPMLSEEIKSEQQSINIEILAEGYYLISIRSNGKSTVRKMIVRK